MRSITAVLVLLALPLPAHAQMAPQQAPGSARLPGISGAHPSRAIAERRPIETHASHSAGAYDPAVAKEIDDALDDIERRRDNGELTRREARRLRREVGRVADLSDLYGHDGLSDAERSELRLHASAASTRANTAYAR